MLSIYFNRGAVTWAIASYNCGLVEGILTMVFLLQGVQSQIAILGPTYKFWQPTLSHGTKYPNEYEHRWYNVSVQYKYEILASCSLMIGKAATTEAPLINWALPFICHLSCALRHALPCPWLRGKQLENCKMPSSDNFITTQLPAHGCRSTKTAGEYTDSGLMVPFTFSAIGLHSIWWNRMCSALKFICGQINLFWRWICA